jgi:hypothetical protein
MFGHSKINATKTVALVTTVLLSVTVVAANAQESSAADTNEQLLACRGISDQVERIACFDAVVEDLPDDSAAPDLPPSGPQPASVAEAPDAIAPAAAAGSATTVITEGPSNSVPAAGVNAAPAAVETNSSNSPAAAAGVSSTSEDQVAPESALAESPGDGADSRITENADSQAPEDAAIASFGLNEDKEKSSNEKVSKKEHEIESLEATIVAAWRTLDNRFEARLDNGQVWRETERTRVENLAKEGVKVRITKGTLGSYNMKFGNNNRLAGVRRTE